MSAWHGGLHARLKSAGITSIIVTGAETEVCVLASVMGAIDLGYRVVIVTDAVCSGADSTHDAMLGIYDSRFGMQVETVTTAELIAAKVDGMLGLVRRRDDGSGSNHPGAGCDLGHSTLPRRHNGERNSWQPIFAKPDLRLTSWASAAA